MHPERYEAWREFRNAWLMLEAHPEPKPELYLLARELCGRIKVVLQGDGGDEMFDASREHLTEMPFRASQFQRAGNRRFSGACTLFQGSIPTGPSFLAARQAESSKPGEDQPGCSRRAS